MNHRLIEERSLAMAQIIASRVRENPQLLETARANLERWMETCSPRVLPVLKEWQAILDRGMESAMNVLLTEDERSTQLRQSNPFAGPEFITRRERADVILAFREKAKQSNEPARP